MVKEEGEGEEEPEEKQQQWKEEREGEKDGESKAVAHADRSYRRYERESRLLRKRSEDYQVVEEVFDMPTMMVITKMVNDGVLKSLHSHFASGKEARVFIAEAPDGSLLAVKIYLTVSAEFRKRMQYIAGDPRFSEIKGGTRNFISIWARKEFKNLQQAHNAGVRVPKPVAVEKNVLVMEFIGDNEGNVAIPLANLENITATDYSEVVKQLKILYQKAGLVHADLSEYNIFKDPQGHVILLDFGSAVDVKHPNSKQFLGRDVQNVNRFFAKRGIDVIDTLQLMDIITSG
jgi:RIO kinase 1